MESGAGGTRRQASASASRSTLAIITDPGQAKPFGTIHGTNITPDRETGIGAWPKAAFVRAMREGVDRAGGHLYPAFPYDHFRLATDDDLAPQHWIALTPPRIPQLRTLQEVVGSQDPVLLDWLVGLAFPCQRPFDHQNGVVEVPKWRILPDRFGAEANSPVMEPGRTAWLRVSAKL